MSCSSCKESEKASREADTLTQEESIELNRQMLLHEEEQIDLFIQRYEWEMKVSDTGFRYDIYFKSESESKPVKGDEIQLKYNVMGLNGEIIYDSEDVGLMFIKVEQDRTPRGIRDGVQMMAVGDKARFILPSHLAYGVHGDENLISHSVVLIYDMELISIER